MATILIVDDSPSQVAHFTKILEKTVSIIWSLKTVPVVLRWLKAPSRI
jgi:PleD family two-component response regulator